MKHNRFESRYGSNPVFTCAICKRRTRMSGQGGHELCFECWELAGHENSVSDNGWEEANANGWLVRERDRLIAAAVKKGSDEALMRAEFARLFPDKVEDD